MNKVPSLLSQLKEQLQSAAFLVGRGNAEKDAHAAIVKSLVLASQIEMEVGEGVRHDLDKPALEPRFVSSARREDVTRAGSHGDTIDREIRKVRRRVPKWFQKPRQNNSIILNRFLELAKRNTQVTVRMLRDSCGEVGDFDGNYNQMKNFGEKNHGKVFEETAGVVVLWAPIKDFVLELYAKLDSEKVS